MYQIVGTAFLLLVILVGSVAQQDAAAQAYLDTYSMQLEALYYRSSLASWAYYTNITDYNREVMTNRSLEVSLFHKQQALNASRFDQEQVSDASMIRQLNKILDVGIDGYEDTNTLRRISDLEADMTGIYSTAKWENKPLEPDLVDTFTNSRDPNELKNAWKGWRDVSGKMMKKQYEEFVKLLNTAIKAEDRYSDIGAYYRSWYEDENFETDVRSLYEELKPLYTQLHAYVRRKLREYFKDENFPTSGHIPAHLFGDMWAQQWSNIYDILEPYPGMGRESLTEEMKRQLRVLEAQEMKAILVSTQKLCWGEKYNITHMYRVAEEFFTSIGLQPMPASFWTNSMLEKPTDGREVVCHASAWDFYNGTDFRIKQCTIVTEYQLQIVHHEMGHVIYYLEYKDQPVLFRGGANPGFHEGVADIASLSFQTPEHLHVIGLLSELPTGTEGDINFLFQMALDKVAFLPFGYLVDQWRWSVFRGSTTSDMYNRDWWKLRCNYQGISPPVARSDDDFDPGAKFHIPGNVPYIRYFVSFVAQFQWHKALCNVIGYNGALHRCDIYHNTQAGQRLREMLRMGASEPWGMAMRKITRETPGETDKLSAAPLLEYFKPLLEWLQAENNRTGERVSWDDGCPSGSFVPFTSKGSKLSSLSGVVLILCTIMMAVYLKLSL